MKLKILEIEILKFWKKNFFSVFQIHYIIAVDDTEFGSSMKSLSFDNLSARQNKKFFSFT